MNKILISFLMVCLFTVGVYASEGDLFSTGENDKFRITSTGGVVASSGTSTFSTMTITTNLYLSSTTMSLSRTSTIIPTSPFIVVVTTGVIDQLTATPMIRAGNVGQIIILRGNNATNTVILSDNGTVSGSLLQLGSATRTLGLYSILGLIYDGYYWIEMFFIAN